MRPTVTFGPNLTSTICNYSRRKLDTAGRALRCAALRCAPPCTALRHQLLRKTRCVYHHSSVDGSAFGYTQAFTLFLENERAVFARISWVLLHATPPRLHGDEREQHCDLCKNMPYSVRKHIHTYISYTYEACPICMRVRYRNG